MHKLSLLTLIVAGVGVLVILSSIRPTAADHPPPFAYVANQTSGTVSVIDLATGMEVASIVIPGERPHPYWIEISADGSVVATTLHHPEDGVAIIDGTTNTLLGVVGGVGDEPEAVAVNSDGSTVYVADEDDEDLYRVDVSTLSVTAGPIDLSASCGEPEAMLISPDDAFLYIACADFGSSTIVRVATAGFGITLLDAVGGDNHGIAMNADGTRIYYGDGTDSREFNTTTLSLTGTVYLGCEMYSGDVSSDGSLLYCQEEGDPLMIFDISDGTLLATLSVGDDVVRTRPGSPLIYLSDGGVVEVVDSSTLMDLPGNIAMTGTGGRGIAIGPFLAHTPTPTPTVTSTPEPEPTVRPRRTGLGPAVAGGPNVAATRRAGDVAPQTGPPSSIRPPSTGDAGLAE